MYCYIIANIFKTIFLKQIQKKEKINTFPKKFTSSYEETNDRFIEISVIDDCIIQIYNIHR